MTGFGISMNNMADTPANRIREDADRQYQRIRGDATLSVPGKQAGVGKVYLAAKAKMTDLESVATGQSETNRQRLMTTAFGIPNDPASAMSYRDACDRADAIQSPSQALELYNRADDTGDRLLAQAIARRAHDVSNHGMFGSADPSWGAILESYCRTRPGAGKAIADLNTLSTSRLSPANMWAFVLPAPPEVAGFTDFQIQQMIDQTSGAA